MANTMTFDQAAVVLNELASQVTGKTAQAPVTTADFITVANTVLQTGYNAVMEGISQVLNRTIFSIRPYSRKFADLNKDSLTWGNHTRKINYIDGEWLNDDRVPLTNGQSLDHYVIRKPEVLQTNFYGGIRYEREHTVTTSELKTAFQGPEELSRFWSGVTSNVNDQIEQGHENLARMALANFMGGKISGDPDNVIHLLTEYNELTGKNLTKANLYTPENFRAFCQWLLSRVATLMDFLTERNHLNHMNVTGKELSRHTPLNLQRVYILSQFVNMLENMAVSDTFNDKYLKMPSWNAVNYWQSPDAPDTINVTPSYMAADGTITTATAALEQADVLGVIFDEEAIGYTTFDYELLSTPVNARGSYYNLWYHWRDRYWNDFTENGIVLLLD